MQRTDLHKYEASLTQQQLDRFKKLTDAVNGGEMTMNKSYSLACQSFDGGDDGVIAGFKGQFTDWINHAKSQGWIDKDGHLVENWSNADSLASPTAPQPIQTIETKDSKGSNTLMTIGVLALGAFILYKTIGKK